MFVLHFSSQIALDFFTFKLRPASLPKPVTVFRAFSKEFKLAQKKFVLSANWLSLISFPNIFIPTMLGSCLILLAGTSAERINKYGERGHPCRTPLEGLKQLVRAVIHHSTLYFCIECGDPSLNTWP